jgi:hypothetical protein
VGAVVVEIQKQVVTEDLEVEVVEHHQEDRLVAVLVTHRQLLQAKEIMVGLVLVGHRVVEAALEVLEEIMLEMSVAQQEMEPQVA